MYFEVQEEIELESVEEEHPVATKSEIHNYDEDGQDATNMQCSDCHRFFKTKQELIAHRLISHQSEKKYQCQSCNRVFSSQSSLHTHMKLHSGDKRFACDVCQKEFTQLTNLQRHLFTHSGERPFACSICDKRFTQKSNVDKHQLTHASKCILCKSLSRNDPPSANYISFPSCLETKPFKCSTCDKAFTQKVNLTKHEMIHSGLRPFVCEICSKAYTQLVNLNKHMQTHTKPRDSVAYLCAKCKQLFDSVLTYTSHLDSCRGTNTNMEFELTLDEIEDNDPNSNKVNILNIIKSTDSKMNGALMDP